SQYSGNLVTFGAHCISTEAEETRPADSPNHIEEEKPTCRHAVGARKQSRKHSQHCDETPKEHDSVPIPEKRYRPISNRSSSRRMHRRYLRRKGKPSLRPTMYPIPSPTIAPAAAASTTTTMLI